MPNSILNADIAFPSFTGRESTDEKIGQITDYLYMLLEELRYSFGNLGVENFNDQSVAEFSEVVTEPIKQSILQLGENVSAVTQTADKINWIVASGSSASEFTLTPRMASLVSESIDLTGYVTFHSLSTDDGTTVINGGNIRSGTISGITLESRGDSGRTLGISNGAIYAEDQYGTLLSALFFLDDGDVYLSVGSEFSFFASDVAVFNAREIRIGGAGERVDINGTVYINGRLIT